MFMVLLLTFSIGHAQEKKTKEQKKLEKQQAIEELIGSKNFVFEGITAYPERGKPINISSGQNTVSFTEEMIKCNLPFFGQVKSASAGYGSPGGYEFEGKPDEFTIDSTKKGWKIKAVVKTGNDNYTLNLSASPDGSANLNVYSLNRSSMRYNGDVKKP